MKIKSNKEKLTLGKVNHLEFDPDEYNGWPRDFFKNTPPDLDHMLDEVIKEKGDFFCSQPWVHMYVPTYGYQHICCNTSMSIKKHISEANFEERYNEPEFTKLREEMIGGHVERDRTLKTCLRCIQTEYRGFTSLRETYNNAANKNPETRDELIRTVEYVKQTGDGNIGLPNKFHTVELKIWGNYCNLKCLMCSPEDSSEVAKEQIALGERTVDSIKETTYRRTGKQVPFEPPLITVDDNHIDEDEYWSIIERSYKLKLIGGETFLQKQNIQLMEKCVEKGWAKDKELLIFTNNFGHPNMERIAELLSHFKRVSYKCSMEMWGWKNDYIRYPSRWDEVYKNIKLIAALPNVKINPTCTLNPLTLGYINEVLEGADEFNANCNFSSVNRPAWFTAHCIPDDIADFYLDKYYSLDYHMIERCQKAIETLEQREFSELRLHAMIAKIKARDKYRGDNILKYFPEWTPYFIGDEYYANYA